MGADYGVADNKWKMFWILALSYWIHLLATIVWLGGMAHDGAGGLAGFKARIAGV